MAKIFTLIPLTLLTIPFVFCLLHNIIISCITSIWLSLQRKWWLELKQLIKCIVQYIINDCNSVTLEGNGNPLQYSCLKNPMDGGAWWAAVHGVAKSQTWLSDFTFTFSYIGEGNGNPLQCSCLENPTDGGAWWAAVYGVA